MTQAEAKSVKNSFLDATRRFYDSVDSVGSMRRKEPNIGDVDLLIVPKGEWTSERRTEWADAVEKAGGHITELGSSMSFLNWRGHHINIWFSTPEERGAAVLWRVGPNHHNIALATVAKNKGWKLNQHGLWDSRGHRIPNTSSPGEILDKLGHTKEECDTRKSAGI